MDNAVATVRSIRDVPPAHYSLKLTSFSLFLDADIGNYPSGVFEAGGYEWKLCIHPNGNEKINVDRHISLYLVIADTETLPPGWEVNVNFKLFVFDQIRDKYLTIQDAEGVIRRFHRMKTEWGFDQFVSVETFNDASNGYLVDDCCVFGAEVFVIKHMGKDESASMVKDPANNIYTSRIEKFSAIDQDVIYSDEFIVGGTKWKLQIYPKGNSSVDGKWLSLYLSLARRKTLPFDRKIFADCKLRVRGEVYGNHSEKEVFCWFCASSYSWRFPKFMALSDLNDASKGFVVNDVLTVEAQITFISSTKDF
ncbi:MATH domain and coiled-coil domain-containing protein At3g58210-like [Rhododendron vialii]|uniref:MATH domain and coiled-coil domain-containing protein At3g58210-like n=1 Tax=Rhododendron vialii TaxID=182163 RepID=UPI0026604686|nr:MATH domain and coiled-coil domain-containing protein At3g58210-like [Rhododendron vialii]